MTCCYSHFIDDKIEVRRLSNYEILQLSLEPPSDSHVCALHYTNPVHPVTSIGFYAMGTAWYESAIA